MGKYIFVKIFIYDVACLIVLIYNPNWISRIQDNIEYGWIDGIWHSFWWLPHFVRNIFKDTNIIGHGGSIMYYVCFCLTPILSIVIARNFFKESSLTEDERNRMLLDDEDRRLHLASTKKERMHNALKKRVSKWLGEIEVNSRKSKMPSGVLSPFVNVNTNSSNDISDLITTQVLNFVLVKNEEEYSLKELNMKELHNILSSTLLEQGFDCNDDEIVELADVLVSYIDESIEASKKLYEE